MAISLKEFIEVTNAEVVGGQLIVGERADRKFVGNADGTFTLNEEGQLIADQIEAGTYGKPEGYVEEKAPAKEEAPVIKASK